LSDGWFVHNLSGRRRTRTDADENEEFIGVNLRLSAAEVISFPNAPEFDDPFF